MKLEIGKYYSRLVGKKIELIYIFGRGGMDIAASLEYPDGVEEEEVDAFLAIKVFPFITKSDFLQFQQSMYTITVYKLTDETTYPCDWVEAFPSNSIVDKFEKTHRFMGLVYEFMEHMIGTYEDRYKDEVIAVKNILD